MGNCEEKIVESLGEVLNIIVFPPKRHQFHNAISARKKIRNDCAQYLFYAII